MGSRTKVFLDTNILLDALDKTRAGHDYAYQIINNLKAFDIYINAVSIANMEYIAKISKQKVKEFCRLFKFSIVDKSTINRALNFPDLDFEDSLQLLCAVRSECEYFITADKHFEQYRGFISVLSAEEFCREMA